RPAARPARPRPGRCRRARPPTRPDGRCLASCRWSWWCGRGRPRARPWRSRPTRSTWSARSTAPAGSSPRRPCKRPGRRARPPTRPRPLVSSHERQGLDARPLAPDGDGGRRGDVAVDIAEADVAGRAGDAADLATVDLDRGADRERGAVVADDAPQQPGYVPTP